MEDTLNEIRKRYSDEAIFLLGDFPKKDVNVIRTGSLLLDHALGVGGIPRGRYTEIFGIDGSGKTTLCQHLVANAQREGLTCAFIDVENAVDLDYAKVCGVDLDSLYFSQPNFAEEALGITELLVKSGEVGLVVIDSIAALSPQKESDDEFIDRNVTAMHRAKLLNVFFRRTTPWMRKYDVAIVLTNQMRDIVGSFYGGIKPVGGHGIKHYASVRVRLSRRKDGEIKSGGQVVGQEIEFLIVKNKVADPYKTDKFAILFGYGIDRETDIALCSATLGILDKHGSYYRVGGETIAQGKANLIAWLKDNPDYTNELDNQCREVLRNG